MTGFTRSPGKMRPGRGSQASRWVLQPSSHLPYVPSEGLTDPDPQPCRHDTYGVKSRAVFGTELGPQHQAAADWKEKKKKKNKYMGRMLWNFGQGLWKSTSPKCVVTHLFHFPLPSECLQKDSDWRVYSAPLPSDDPASPSHCANWAVRFFFFLRQESWRIDVWHIIFMHAGQSTCSKPMIGCTLVISNWPWHSAPIYVPVFLSRYYQEILKMYCTVLSMLQTEC